MKAVEEWRPSKFVLEKGQLLPSDDPAELGIGSRIVAECMAAQYQLALQKYAHGRLLDLGCGKVPLYAVYRDLVDEAVCVDWQSGLHGSKHVDFFRDLNKDLELPANSFDTVILSDVLEHIRMPEKLIGQIHGLLRAGGVAILGVPFFYWIHEEPYDFFRYTKFALAAMAEEAGFEVCYLEETGGAPEILADLAGKLMSPVPIIQKSFVRCARMMRRTSIAKRLTARTRVRFPLGYLMVARKISANGETSLQEFYEGARSPSGTANVKQ
jgi:SAM-dependent methyltransferase